MAAVLACGDGAVLSHRSAAYLYVLLPYPARYGEVHVTVAIRTPPERPGIRVHRAAALDRRDVIERSAGRPGVILLRDLWVAEAAGQRNRLEAEKRFDRLITAARLPKPVANGRVGRFVVDFLWPHHRVAVELDGFATHSRRQAFEADRARDGDLQAIGYAVVRVTWRQVTREAPAVLARVAAVLALSGPESTDRR